MKANCHCMPEACPEASPRVQLVQIEVSPAHPLLVLKRVLPWEAITEAMTRHWREHGKNVDGGPGLPWEVSLYAPLVVLMLIKHFDSRQMEAYVAENVVARVFIGRHQDVHAQIRDHSNMARAYAALGKAGIEEVTHLVIQQAHGFGFVDEGVMSSDTPAQELPIGYPNEPGILRGLAQRCGRAFIQLKKRGIQGLEAPLEQVETILRSVKEHHLFTKSKADKRQVLTRILTEVGTLISQSRVIASAVQGRSDRVIQSARSRLVAMQDVIKVSDLNRKRTPYQVQLACVSGYSRPVVDSHMATLLSRGAGTVRYKGLEGAVVQQGMTVMRYNGAVLVRIRQRKFTKRA